MIHPSATEPAMSREQSQAQRFFIQMTHADKAGMPLAEQGSLMGLWASLGTHDSRLQVVNELSKWVQEHPLKSGF